MNKYLNRLRPKRYAKNNAVTPAVATARGTVNVMVVDLMERLIEAMDEVNA